MSNACSKVLKAFLVACLALGVSADPSRRMSDRYKVLLEGKPHAILENFERQAAEIDSNGDGVLSLQEFAATSTRLPGRLSTDEDYAQNMAYEYAGRQTPYASGYPDSSGVEARLRSIADQHRGSVALALLGSTSENRSVWALRIGAESFPQRAKIAIIAGQHAREWMGPQVALAAAERLLSEGPHEHLLQQYEIWVLPLANPDGYDYSLSNEAMWMRITAAL